MNEPADIPRRYVRPYTWEHEFFGQKNTLKQIKFVTGNLTYVIVF